MTSESRKTPEQMARIWVAGGEEEPKGREERPWQWEEDGYTVTRTCRWSAPGCHDGCGVLYYTKAGKLVKVEGDPEQPWSNGTLCPRCLTLPESVNNPSRVMSPLKRVGERGSNEWEPITWDEAYDLVVKNVRQIQDDFGPESIVSMIGTGRNIWAIAPKLTFSGFGSPNLACGFLSGDACYLPRAALQGVMFGDFFVADMSQNFPKRYDDPRWTVPECIVVWGNNAVVSNPDGFLGHWIVESMKRGSRLIVVDPELTWLASRADYWLQIRPGTDDAMTMAWLKVVIEEGLYDADVVDEWTYGFDELKARVAEYSLHELAEKTWVPEEKILAAARLYAQSKPAAIQWGLAFDTSTNGWSAIQAVASLWTITGNLDVPGGNIMVRPPFGSKYSCCISDWDYDTLPEDLRAKRLGLDKYPVYSAGFCATSNSDSVLTAIETERPYPVKMLWLHTTNPFVNMGAEAKRVYAAIKKVPFVVVVDPWLTPTAVACADLVLPAAMSPERNSVRGWWAPLRSIVKVVDPPGDIKTDEEIVLELGKRLNPDAFPWDTVEEMDDWVIKGAGFDVQELKERVYAFPKFEYLKHEKGLLRPDGQPGFNTPTGRVELWVSQMAALGLEPLPHVSEPLESPYSTPQLAEEYPLILTAGTRSIEFFHSENRQDPTSRELHPNPRVKIHPDTARALGIVEGDWVWIENHRGKVKQVAKVTAAMDPRVVSAEHGWWFPEKKAEDLFGAFESNINVLTAQGQNGPNGYCAPYKVTLCRVSRV